MFAAGCGKDEAVILPERTTILSGQQSGNISDTEETQKLGYEEEALQEKGAAEEETSHKRGTGEDPHESSDDRTPVKVTVYVCGAVVNPGVYTLDEGKRISDAVELAGGMNDEANRDYINQAMLLSDSQKIYIPRQGEMINAAYEDDGTGGTGSGSSETGSDAVSGKVNINTGSAQELMTLPGIGEAKAKLIIEYRDSNGGFSRIEDIMKISGIKEGMFKKIKDRICI